MHIHATIAYIRYRMQARGRHGTHSPFVYHFVEQVLRSPTGSRAATHTTALLAQLSAVYGLPVHSTPTATPCIWTLPATPPHTWASLLAPHTSVLTQGFIALPGIHSTPQHSHHWALAAALPSVAMSIDLYHTGLLLSRPAFKEKQHFVLR